MPSRATMGDGRPDEEEIDDDLDLPPLDADGGDEPALDEEPLLPEDPEEGGLDDSVAADLDVGEEVDALDEDEDGDGDGPDAGVDVGALDEGIDVDERSGGVGDEDLGEADAEGIAIDETRDADDGGAEGTGESPEDAVDEGALPELDDGEDGGGEEDLARALLAESKDDLPPWAPVTTGSPVGAPRRVALLEGAGAQVPCGSVAVSAGRVAAAGEVLLLVEEGARAARRVPFGEGVVAVALAEEALLAATSRGQLLAGLGAGQRGGAEATSLGAFRGGSGASRVTLAATPGRFWILAGTSLSCVALPARAPGLAPASMGAPALVRERGVLAIAASGSTLVAVTLGTASTTRARRAPILERFRGDDEGAMEAPLEDPARALVERSREASSAGPLPRYGRAPGLLLAVAAGGRCLALGDGRALVLSRDGGATFASIDPGPAVALAFEGEAPDAPLLALVVPDAAGAGASPAFLVEIGVDGEAQRIGEIAATERELPSAIAWDPARELIWVASGAGLCALGAPRPH